MLMGVALICMQVRSPMLVAVGMYLPFETTFAIFVGGVFRSISDAIARRRRLNEAQQARVENAGVLTASGMIAGEAILGLVWAALQFAPQHIREHLQIVPKPLYSIGLLVLAALGWVMIYFPLRSAGAAHEPAPPTGIV
jgi:uncharacterized protein YoaH (UPF0181 family)